jgi:NAD dependent epimerase/dehydratase family enzyme
MTVLITGATGLIGRALTQSLVGSGLNPRVLTRRPHRALEIFVSRVTAFEWHPRTEPLPLPALDGVERVVHLMGEPLYGPLDREKRSRIVASRRIGTKRLIEALGRTRVHLIVASSAAVYGYGEGPPITETTAIQPPKDRLALALLGCEEEADGLRENGSIVTLVRLGPVIAPGGFPELLRDLFDRRITWRNTHPDAAIPAIDHADAVALFAWLAQSRPLPGPIHAVAPEPLLSSDLGALLEKVSTRRWRASLPRPILRREAGVLADFVHSRQRIVPRRALDAGFAFTHPSPLERVRSVLARPDTQSARAGSPALDPALQKP